jgi:diguanylate cyclase (GGDEF)-like protein
MVKNSIKISYSLHQNQYFLALFFGAIGALINLYPIELAYNISLVVGNAAYIIAASFLRPSLTLLCAFVTAMPLYFYWGHPFGFVTFGLEAWFISMLRTRGWYVLNADLLYWFIIGMPITAVLLWYNLNTAPSVMLFTIFKQVINAMLYTSLACIILFTFNDYFQSIKSSQPPLVKSLPQWLSYSFWSISAFFVICVSLVLSTNFGELQKAQLEKELEINNNYITHIGNSYLNEHQQALQNIAYQLSTTRDLSEREIILSKFHALYPGFLTMLIASKDGDIDLASPRSIMEILAIDKQSVIDRPYFIHAMKDQKLFISSVFLGRGFGNDPIIAISAPLYSNESKETPSGIVEGSLDLGKFGLYDKIGHDEKQIKTIVTDKNDRIIYASRSLELESLSVLKFENKSYRKTSNLISLIAGVNSEEMFIHKQTQLMNDWKIHSLVEHKVALKIIENMYLVMFLTLFVTLLTASFFAKRFAIHLNRPLAFVMKQLSKAKKTGDFRDVPFETPTEIEELYQELKVNRLALLQNQDELQEQVLKRTSELNQANLKLTEQANTDILTGLHNRRYFDKHFILMQSIFSRNKSQLMYAIIDLDLFKKINDTHGHLFGDFCLIEVAKILKRFFNREADIVARFGGEEFVLVSQCDNVELLRKRMDELCKYIAAYVFEDGLIGPVKVTISMGISVGEASYSNQQEEWFSVADKCLYDAKHNGRNQTKLEVVSAVK